MLCGLVAADRYRTGIGAEGSPHDGAGLFLGAVGPTSIRGGRVSRWACRNCSTASASCQSRLACSAWRTSSTHSHRRSDRPHVSTSIERMRAQPGESRRAALSTARGTLLGSFLGVLPGGGPLIASFASYAVEGRVASAVPPVGSGAIEGVAGPESANNAAAQTSFIPLLTLGLPSNAIMALLLGALIVHGIKPGPAILSHEPALFWGLVASMWLGTSCCSR